MYPNHRFSLMSAGAPRRAGFVRPLATLLLLAALAALLPRTTATAQQPAATAAFNLGALNGPNGFRIDGRNHVHG